MPSAFATSLPVLTRVRRQLLIHRRGLLALCLAVLAWCVISAAHPPAAAGEPVWVAVRDLPSGAVLSAADLTSVVVPAAAAPRAAHGLRAILGRTLAAPLGQGETATVTQTMGNDRLRGYPGRSAVPVRIPDPDTVDLLHPGDHLELVASDPQQHGPGVRIAQDAVVLAVPATPSTSSATRDGRLVVLAVPSEDVLAVASAAARLLLTVIWNR